MTKRYKKHRDRRGVRRLGRARDLILGRPGRQAPDGKYFYWG